MNKKFMLFLIFMFVIPIVNVNASSNKIKITSDNEYVYYNEEFTINIGINSSDPLNNIDGILEYDKTKLELIEIDTYKGIDCSFNDKVSCVSKNAVTNGNLFYAIFKPKSTLKVDQNVSISFKKININDGTSKEDDISKTFKVLKDKINADVSLKSLTVNNTSVLENNKYTTTNDNIIISGTPNSNSTTIIGLGNKALKIGENIFNVVAISESGLKKAYVIKIYRKELPSEEHKEEIKEAEEKTNNYINKNNNNNGSTVNNSSNNKSENSKSTEKQLLLTSIEIDGYTLNFNPYKFIYRFSVASNVNSLNIKTLADKDIDVSVEQDEELAFGENIIIINLKKDDETNKYILYVTREETKKSNLNGINDSTTSNIDDNKNNGTTKCIIIVPIIALIILCLVLLFKRKRG